MSLWSIVGGLIEVGIASLGKEDAEKKAAQRYKDHSVSCRKCTGLAGPISGTTRNYRCSCGHQFSGPHHPY